MKIKYLFLVLPLLLVSCDRTVVSFDEMKEGTKLSLTEIKTFLHLVNSNNENLLSEVNSTIEGSMQTDSLHGEGFGYYQETSGSINIQFGATQMYSNLPQEKFHMYLNQTTDYRDKRTCYLSDMDGVLYAEHYYDEEIREYSSDKFMISIDLDYGYSNNDKNYDWEWAGNVGMFFLNLSENEKPYYSQSQIEYMFSIDKWISYYQDYENLESDDYKISYQLEELYTDYENEAEIVVGEDGIFTLYHRQIVKSTKTYGEATITFADITSTVIEFNSQYFITSFTSTTKNYSDGDYDGNEYGELREYGSTTTKTEYIYGLNNVFEPVMGGSYSTNF